MVSRKPHTGLCHEKLVLGILQLCWHGRDTYLIGKDGVVKFASVGYDPKDFAELKKAIAVELKK